MKKRKMSLLKVFTISSLTLAITTTVMTGCGKESPVAMDKEDSGSKEIQSTEMISETVKKEIPKYDVFCINSYDAFRKIEPKTVCLKKHTTIYKNYKKEDGSMMSIEEADLETRYPTVNAMIEYQGKYYYANIPEDDEDRSQLGSINFYSEDDVALKIVLPEKLPGKYMTWEEIEPKFVYAKDYIWLSPDKNDYYEPSASYGSAFKGQVMHVDARGTYDGVEYYRLVHYQGASYGKYYQTVRVEDVSDEVVKTDSDYPDAEFPMHGGLDVDGFPYGKHVSEEERKFRRDVEAGMGLQKPTEEELDEEYFSDELPLTDEEVEEYFNDPEVRARGIANGWIRE